MESHNVSISFIQNLPLYATEKPYNVERSDSDGGRISNLVFERHNNVKCHNARGQEHEFSLQKQGFKWLVWPSEVTLLPGTDDFVEAYIKEAIQIIEAEFSPDKIIAYDCRTRKNASREQIRGLSTDPLSRTTPLTTAPDVHIGISPSNYTKSTLTIRADHTLDGAYRRIKRHLTVKEAEEMTADEWRIRIVNLWRPLYYPVRDSALAVCDFRSLQADDLLAADHVNPQYHGEVYYVKYNKAQRWYWLKNQTPDEVTLFVSFDSQEGEDARFCAHVAIQDPTETESQPIRESVEVRAIIFTHEPRIAAQ